MDNNYYQLYIQFLALKTALSAIVKTLPDEQKDIVLKLLQAFADSGLDTDLLGKAPDLSHDEAEKLNRVLKQTYEDIIGEASDDLYFVTSPYLQ